MSLIQKTISEQSITQAELASRLRVSPKTVSAWVQRRRIPRPHTIKKIAEELQIGAEKLLADICR